MNHIEHAITSYHSWLFRPKNEKADTFILLCVAAGLLLFLVAPPVLLPMAFILAAAGVVPIIDRRMHRHPGEAFLNAVDEDYLSAYGEYFAGEMRRRGAPEGMITMDVGLIWVYHRSEDHEALFLHLHNLQTKLEKIDGISTVHKDELSAMQSGEGASEDAR